MARHLGKKKCWSLKCHHPRPLLDTRVQFCKRKHHFSSMKFKDEMCHMKNALHFVIDFPSIILAYKNMCLHKSNPTTRLQLNITYNFINILLNRHGLITKDWFSYIMTFNQRKYCYQPVSMLPNFYPILLIFNLHTLKAFFLSFFSHKHAPYAISPGHFLVADTKTLR